MSYSEHSMKTKQKLTLLILFISFFNITYVRPVFAANACSESNIIQCTEEDGITFLIKTSISILTVLIAIAAVIGIIYGAVLYTSSGGNAENTKKARGIITNTIIGIVAYALMYVILNFLIPGGLIAGLF